MKTITIPVNWQEEDDENEGENETRANTRRTRKSSLGYTCSRIFHYHSIRTSFSRGLGGEERKVIAIDSTRPSGGQLKA